MCLAIPRRANARGEEQPPGHGVAVAFHCDKDVFVLNCQECPKLYPRGLIRSAPESHSRRWPGKSCDSFSTFKNEGIVDRSTLGAEVKQSGRSKVSSFQPRQFSETTKVSAFYYFQPQSLESRNYKNNALAFILFSPSAITVLRILPQMS